MVHCLGTRKSYEVAERRFKQKAPYNLCFDSMKVLPHCMKTRRRSVFAISFPGKTL
ncbi:hypothetical protein AGR13a_Cc10020 [Agrobacterium genomosp. 13 str. CFBP 6927]|uniref:Uncharacterized protein n=1 Tax=Agrobacterium genomosp. 13 str. CFBP 6927 TaxID=1183428 RepID=A0ABP2BC98_9HYPH|nr:hypothetical protein AGR13a_Cc10020 [Agrobacterium genomosp. 13 str. CFBP 6927]